MTWYYVEASRQVGPVTDEEFQQLVRDSRIMEDTLVWREDMPEWKPWAAVKGTTQNAPPITDIPMAEIPPVLTSDEVVCVECRKTFTRDNAIQYGNSWVCANCKPQFIQKVREGVTPTLELGPVVYAGFWVRFLAYVLDQIILAVPMFLLAMFAGIIMGSSGQNEPVAIGVGFAVNGMTILLSAAYEIWFIGKMGATPGKMALGLKVVDAHATPFTYGRATGRFFGKMLSGMICAIGYLMVAFDEDKRGLHDRLCNTRVIRVR